MNVTSRNIFGLYERDVQTLGDIFNKYPEVICVYIIGSRAKGNFKPGSDIDLVIMNEGATDSVIQKIKTDIEESTLPYFVDLINYPALQHADLKDHIDRVGQLFYQRQP
ncbi:MAG: nucleotidyltransferase domain-containing protein [Desulfobacteraceae bacterium]|nr:nucleotidyltransferase domain-containing protein [Desulfobacteraceae bacterium]